MSSETEADISPAEEAQLEQHEGSPHEAISEAIEPVSAAEDVPQEAVAAPVVMAETTVSAINAVSTPAETAPASEKKYGQTTTYVQVKQKMDKAMRTAQDFMSFSQGNFEAMVKSGQIWAAGVQDLSKQVAASAQAHMDEGMSAFKALSSVKSLKEAFDLQASLARASMEKAVSETGRLTDASLKLAEEAIAPLTARVTLAVETFSKTA